MALSTDNVILWVKSEPFNYGSLPVAPYPKLSLNNIKKIIPYTRSKETDTFPFIRYSMWKHIACNKLLMSEELAWMYFSLCHVLSEEPHPADKDDSRQPTSIDQTEIFKGDRRVNQFKLVLFLFIQQLHKVSLKASLVAGDEWPSSHSSHDFKSIAPHTVADEGNDLQFVQNNLLSLLSLLIEPDSYVNPSSESTISLAALEAFSFILGASSDGGKTSVSIHSVALMQAHQNTCGYLKLNRTFSVRSLQNWIFYHLSHNPFGLAACLSNGKGLPWPLTVVVSNGDKKTVTRRGKAVTNVNLVPKDSTVGNKLIVVSQLSRQTLARSGSLLEGSSVKIHRCHYSFIYLLSPLRSATLEKCRHTTVVLGAVQTNIIMSHCDHVTVITATRHITLTSCSLCILYLLTDNPPILLGGNDSVLLAPYHTWYPKLEQHLRQVGLEANYQLWEQPLCVGPDHKQGSPVWQHLPLNEFFLFTIPFQMDGPTTSIPGGLPSRYQRVIDSRQRELEAWQSVMRDAQLTHAQRKEMQTLVQSRFHIWLSETGYKNELNSLVHPLNQITEKQ